MDKITVVFVINGGAGGQGGEARDTGGLGVGEEISGDDRARRGETPAADCSGAEQRPYCAWEWSCNDNYSKKRRISPIFHRKTLIYLSLAGPRVFLQ